MDISRIINLFFKKNNIFENLEENIDDKIKQMFEPTYNKLKSKFIIWKKDPQIIKRLEVLNTVNSNLEKYKIGYEIIQSFLLDETTRELILNILEILLHNIEEIILSVPIIDKTLYNSLSKFIKAISINNAIKTKEIAVSFGSDFFKRIDFFTIIESILIFQEKRQDKREFEEILENANENEYKKYISDWTLKYAQIIEGPLKNALLLLLKLKYISWGRSYNYLDKRDISIGYVLNKLNTDTFLANYRNSIFHQNLYLTKEHEIKLNKIIFNDREKQIILSLEDYINDFFKVIIFLITFYLVLFKIYLDLYDQPKQIIEKIIFSAKEYIDRFISNSYEDFLIFLD